MSEQLHQPEKLKLSDDDKVALEFNADFGRNFSNREVNDFLALLETEACRSRRYTRDTIFNDPDRDLLVNGLSEIANRVGDRFRASKQTGSQLALADHSEVDDVALKQARPAQVVPGKSPKKSLPKWIFPKDTDAPVTPLPAAEERTLTRRELLKTGVALLLPLAIGTAALNQPETPAHKAKRVKTILETLNHLPKKLKFTRSELCTDSGKVSPGAELTAAGVQQQIEHLIHARWSNQLTANDPDETQRFVNTIQLLRSAHRLWPHASRYQIVEDGRLITLKPAQTAHKAPNKPQHHSDSQTN